MRVYIDHTQCPEWGPASERCFGSFALDPEHVRSRACFLRQEDDGHEELTVVIYNPEGEKVLVITDENRGEVFDGYLEIPDMRQQAIRRGLISEQEIEAGWRHRT